MSNHVPTLASIRMAEERDIDVLTHFNQCIARETEGIELIKEQLAAGIRRLISDPSKGFYIVYEIESRVVGCLMITKEWSDWRNGDFWWIQSVYVDKDFRRKGIYRSMYAYVQQLAELLPEVCGFRLYVEQHNQQAQATYQGLGMQKTHYLLFEQLKPNIVFHL